MEKSSIFTELLLHIYLSGSLISQYCFQKTLSKPMMTMFAYAAMKDIGHRKNWHWPKQYPWWRHQMEIFSAFLAICAGNSPVPVNSPHKGQWRGALMFSLICVWINDWVNNREAGDVRRYRGHYDVIVMRINRGLNWTCLWRGIEVRGTAR